MSVQVLVWAWVGVFARQELEMVSAWLGYRYGERYRFCGARRPVWSPDGLSVYVSKRGRHESARTVVDALPDHQFGPGSVDGCLALRAGRTAQLAPGW